MRLEEGNGRTPAALKGPGLLTGSLLLVGPLTLIVLLATLAGDPTIEATVKSTLIYIVAVVGLSLFWGNSGIMSLGHAAFMAIGAYAGALATLDPVLKQTALPDMPGWLSELSLPFAVGVLVAGAVALVVAVVAGLPLFRFAGAAFVIASYGVLVIVNVVLNTARNITGGAESLYGLAGDINVWLALAFAVGAIVVARAFRDSRAGLELRATREDELAAQAIGIAPGPRRFQAWVISAVMAALAGFLLGVFLSAFSPAAFYLSLTVTLIAMVLVGGLRTVSGAVVGTVIVVVWMELLQRAEQSDIVIGPLNLSSIQGLTTLGLTAAILLTLYLRPRGLVGDDELDEKLFGRVPRRRRRLARGAERGGGGAARPAPRPGEGAALRALDVAVHFESVKALRGVSIELPRGAIRGLMGPNGSGKTTLLNVLSGVYSPTAGAVRLNERDVTGWRPHQFARAGVGRTFQNIRLFADLSALENVEVAIRDAGNGAGGLDAWQLLEAFDLVDDAGRQAGTLPYGSQRRLEIARALALSPSYLLLDEPAAGMNDHEADELRARIQGLPERFGCGVLIVDHTIRLMMDLCEEITVLDAGEEIAHGSPDVIHADRRVREVYLGEPVSGEEGGGAAASPPPGAGPGRERARAPE